MNQETHASSCFCDECKLKLVFRAFRVRSRELRPEQTAQNGLLAGFETDSGFDVGFMTWDELAEGIGEQNALIRGFLRIALELDGDEMIWVAHMKSGLDAVGDLGHPGRWVDLREVLRQASSHKPSRADLSATERTVLDFMATDVLERGRSPYEAAVYIAASTELDEGSVRRALHVLEGFGFVRRPRP